MFATKTLVRQLGRQSARSLTTTRHSIYNQRRAGMAAIGLTGIAGTWSDTRRKYVMVASGADETRECGDSKYVNLANQPSAVPTKGVAMGVKEDTHMVTNIGNASRSESKPVQAIQTKPVTSQILELDARTILTHAQPVETTAPIVKCKQTSKPKCIVGGNYTAAKRHDDNEDDEKWFTC